MNLCWNLGRQQRALRSRNEVTINWWRLGKLKGVPDGAALDALPFINISESILNDNYIIGRLKNGIEKNFVIDAFIHLISVQTNVCALSGNTFGSHPLWIYWVCGINEIISVRLKLMRRERCWRGGPRRGARFTFKRYFIEWQFCIWIPIERTHTRTQTAAMHRGTALYVAGICLSLNFM